MQPVPDPRNQPPLKGKALERETREAGFLEAAQAILVAEGYLGLTMDKLAKETGYAKGTLYLHFKNKEDLICALLREFQVLRMELFDRVSALDESIPNRGRLMAIGLAAEVFVLAYPENARIEPILKAASLREKATPERLQALEAIELFCFTRVSEAVQRAVDAGELTLQPHESPEQLVMGLWSMHVGFTVLHQSAQHLGQHIPNQPCPSGNPLPHAAFFPIAQRLLDGFGWAPLSTEFDYPELRKHLLHKHFKPEAERAKNVSGVHLL